MNKKNITEKTRISLISYLNAVPLTYSLLFENIPSWIEKISQRPSESADSLKRGEVDVALLPSIEYARIDNLLILPSMCIASPGTVRSVILVLKAPLKNLKKIALTKNSRTSAALTKLLCRKRFEISVEFSNFSTVSEVLEGKDDAFLLIGDNALMSNFSQYQIIDMAEEWNQWTSLPFVFAFWAVKKNKANKELFHYLHTSMKKGISKLDHIANYYAMHFNLPKQTIIDYLGKNLSYKLGLKEIDSLKLFFKLCTEENILEQNRELEFFDA